MTLTFAMRPNQDTVELKCGSCGDTKQGEPPRYGGKIVCLKCGGLMSVARGDEAREEGQAMAKTLEAAEKIAEEVGE